MTIKEWLNRGRKLDDEINELLEEQHRAFTKAMATACGGYDEKVQTSKGNATEDRFVNYVSYSELIDRRIDELYAIKQEILSAINKVSDSTLRTLLIKKYIKFYTWERISCDMNYSYVHVVHNLHPKALDVISKIVNSI